MSARDPRLVEAVAGWPIRPDGVLTEIRTLPGAGVVHAWRVLRLLEIWSASPVPVPVAFDRRGTKQLEISILHADYDEGIRNPLAVLARLLTPRVKPDPVRLGWACLCVAEWAISDGGAPETARSFIYAAARITGLDSYMALARAAAASEWQPPTDGGPS
jgi:hypothetical protein